VRLAPKSPDHRRGRYVPPLLNDAVRRDFVSEPERSRWWKLGQSWWIALVAAGFGFLTWLGFGYVGSRTKRRRWLWWAAVYSGGIVVASYLLSRPGYGWAAGLGTIGLVACWIGGLVHALVIRDEVLDVLSVYTDPRLRQARRRLRHRGAAGGIATANPALAREAGIGADARTFGGLVDINDASAEQLADLPGITRELACRIVEFRETIGGFDSVLDFAILLDLPPQFTGRIRDRLICLPR
jgi:helix-hairpin-helix protein